MKVQSLTLSALLLALPFLMTACFNRPAVSNGSLPASAYGVKTGQPSIVTFSALWCHPCREEIETLNRANEEFAGQIQIAGFLLEGEEKGSPVQEGDLTRFASFTGAQPTYPMRLDTGWQLFDRSHTPQGRALPTMLIIDRSGHTQEIVQQSLDYATQLRPIILALLAGDSAPSLNPDPQPAPAPAGTQSLTDSIGNWLARAEVAARPELATNLTAAWQAGLTKYDFTVDEMPLNAGTIAFAWDGGNQNTPMTAGWKAETATSVCQLHLVLNADATLASLSGSCKPK